MNLTFERVNAAYNKVSRGVAKSVSASEMEKLMLRACKNEFFSSADVVLVERVELDGEFGGLRSETGRGHQSMLRH